MKKITGYSIVLVIIWLMGMAHSQIGAVDKTWQGEIARLETRINGLRSQLRCHRAGGHKADPHTWEYLRMYQMPTLRDTPVMYEFRCYYCGEEKTEFPWDLTLKEQKGLYQLGLLSDYSYGNQHKMPKEVNERTIHKNTNSR